jgi:putative oxidoreductase
MIEGLNGDRWRRWVPVPIRMIIGAGFMVHGWAKWSRGPAAFAELLKQVGVPLPLANAWFVTLLEIFGGLAVLMGGVCRRRKRSTDPLDAGGDVYRQHQVRL